MYALVQIAKRIFQYWSIKYWSIKFWYLAVEQSLSSRKQQKSKCVPITKCTCPYSQKYLPKFKRKEQSDSDIYLLNKVWAVKRSPCCGRPQRKHLMTDTSTLTLILRIHNTDISCVISLSLLVKFQWITLQHWHWYWEFTTMTLILATLRIVVRIHNSDTSTEYWQSIIKWTSTLTLIMVTQHWH